MRKIFHIEMDTSHQIKLMEVRKRAFTAGVLQSEDEDWIKGFVFADNKMMKSDMRLKGDWLDHLHGKNWSFRLKLKKGNTWNNMRVFSIQSPLSRLGVNGMVFTSVYDFRRVTYYKVWIYPGNDNWRESWALCMGRTLCKTTGGISKPARRTYSPVC